MINLFQLRFSRLCIWISAFVLFSFPLYCEEKKETVLIPVTEYNRLIKELNGSVLMPLDRYRTILETLHGVKKVSEPKESLIIEYAKYTVDVQGKSAVFDVEFGLNFIKRGWHEIEGIQSGYSTSFLLDGKRARYLEKNEDFYIFSNNIGRYSFRCKMYWKPFVSDRGNYTLNLEMVEALRDDFFVNIPHKNLRIRTEGLSLIDKAETDDATRLHLVSSGRMSKVLEWSREKVTAQDGKIALPPRFVASVSSLYRPHPSRIFATHMIGIQMLQGAVGEVEVGLPTGLKVISVEGEGVNSYSVTESEASPVLKLKLSKPLSESLVVLLEMEGDVTPSSLLIKPPSVFGANRQNGFVAVSPQEPAFFVELNRGAFNRMDVRELPPELVDLSGTEPSVGFRYRVSGGGKIEPLNLGIEYQPSGDVLTSYVDHAEALTLVTIDGLQISHIKYDVKTTSSQYLRLEMPEGAVALSVFVDSKAAPAVSEGNDLIIPLRGKRGQQEYSAELFLISEGKQFAEEGGLEILLPKSTAPVKILNWQAYLPTGYEYDEFGGNARVGSPALHASPLSMKDGRVQPFTKARKGAAMGALKSITVQESLSDKDESRLEREGKPSEAARAKPSKPAVDTSVATLSLKLSIPRVGVRKNFYSVLPVEEMPKITCEYEKE